MPLAEGSLYHQKTVGLACSLLNSLFSIKEAIKLRPNGSESPVERIGQG